LALKCLDLSVNVLGDKFSEQAFKNLKDLSTIEVLNLRDN